MTSRKTSITELGTIIKKYGQSVNISYGSGGFCVVLEENKAYGYDWDLDNAIEKAVERAENMRYTQKELRAYLEEYEEEELTRPDLKVESLARS